MTTPIVAARRLLGRSWRGTRRRGSALLVSLIFSSIIAVSITSYMKLATSSLQGASRSFYSRAAVNIAQCGVEEAMTAFYYMTAGHDPKDAWAGWQRTGKDATRTFTGFEASPGVPAEVKVYVRNVDLVGEPVIVAKSIVRPSQAAPIETFLEVSARPRSIFSRGFVARLSVKANSATYCDSWDSDPDNDPNTPFVPYSTAVRRSNGGIAVTSTVDGAVTLSSSQIYGTVSTGGGIIVYDKDAVISRSFTGTGIDWSLVTQDFRAAFPSIVVPTPSTVNTISSTPPGTITFPRTGDRMASDGKYYYNFGINTHINVGSKDITTISRPCVFLFNNHTGVSSIENKGALTISVGATLTIYTSGTIYSEGGNGVINGNNHPAACLVFGTDTVAGRQKVTFSGVSGGGMACYMPNAVLTLTGNGSINGSFIAYAIDLKGKNTEFHFDEALTRVGTAAGLTVSRWRQLITPQERATYASSFNF